MRFFYAQVMTQGKITLSGQKQVSISGGKFQTILLLILQSIVRFASDESKKLWLNQVLVPKSHDLLLLTESFSFSAASSQPPIS